MLPEEVEEFISSGVLAKSEVVQTDFDCEFNIHLNGHCVKVGSPKARRSVNLPRKDGNLTPYTVLLPSYFGTGD